MKVDDLNLIKCLGKGSFGEVFLTTIDNKKGLYATKKMDRKYADQPHVSKYLKNEISILRELNHINIVKLEDVKITQNHYYLVMEFCNGGSLSDCLKKYQQKFGKPFSEEIVQYLMKQIVNGIKYIHSRHIIHRDLKLDNILVNFDSEIDKNDLNMMKAIIKIIDFGFATHMGKANLAYTALGSPINMDPKILKKMTDNKNGINTDKLVGYDQKADIWSLGTLCYEMIIGKSAFNCQSMEELIKKVESGNYSIPTSLSKELVSFLNGMLQYNSQKRLSASELARHHFLTKNVRDFEPIEIRKVSNKIQQNQLNINIKKNNTIWSIFNEEDEQKLINIPTNYLIPQDSPINEEDEFNRTPPPENKRRNTEKIPQIPKFNNNNNLRNFPHKNKNQNEIAKRRTENFQGYGTGNNGISPYNNNNNMNNNRGYGYGNYPQYPPYMDLNMPPNFPYQNQMMGPPSSPYGERFVPEPGRNQMMGPPAGPFIGRVGPEPGRNQMMGPPTCPYGGRFGPEPGRNQMMGPPTGPFIGRVDPEPRNEMMNRNGGFGPVMQLPTFGVPSPGEDPNAISAYGYNGGIFPPRMPYASGFGNGGYGYGYGY